MPTMMKALLVLAGLAAPERIAPAAPPPSAGGPACSGFSDEQLHRTPPLAWRFRSCSETDNAGEVHVQFRNRSSQPITFRYRIWVQPISSCRTDVAPSSQGTRTLAGNAAEEWPYTVHELGSNREFKGRIWVCVKEVER